MTPKEKAEEIFMMYVDKVMNQIKPVIHRAIRKEMAKQCALIAVELKLDSDFVFCSIEYKASLGYWQEVKTEIQKL